MLYLTQHWFIYEGFQKNPESVKGEAFVFLKRKFKLKFYIRHRLLFVNNLS